MMHAVLTPSTGPADPPSSRPNAGVLGGHVFEFSFVPAAGVQRVTVPGFESIDIAPDAVLDWAFYADGDAAALAPFAALAVSVDVRAGDTLLSDVEDLQCRYGWPITADAQFAAQWSFPDQWNGNSVQLARLAGSLGAVEVVLGAAGLTGTEPVTGFVEVRLSTRVDRSGYSPAARVDTRRGSHSGDRYSRGNTIPAVAVPHGFTFVTPATDASNSRWPYRPFLHDELAGRRLEALQFSHQPSPWIGDRSVLQVMPFVGGPQSNREARRSWLTSESATPFAYSATLDSGIRVAMTATSHCAAFSCDGEGNLGFVIDQLTNDGRLTLASDGSFSGWVPEGDASWGNAPRAYFAGVVTGASEHGSLDDDGRDRVAGFVRGTGHIEVRIAQSFISIEQAKHSLTLEMPHSLSFDAIREQAHAAWDDVCGRVSIPPIDPALADVQGLAHDEQRARIASSLYRLHLYPNIAHENAGTVEAPRWQFADPMQPADAHGDDATGAPVVDGSLVVNNGYWDTYRTAWPALTLVDPAGTSELLDGLLTQFRRGGWMARWSAPGYVDSMVGTSSDQIFADAERWGLPLAEATAFESAWRNACEPSAESRMGRKGIDRGRFAGYITRDVHEGMSWSLENAMSDAAIGRWSARIAARGGDDAARMDAFARYFDNRSRSYRQLFDAEHGFFRGRVASGVFGGETFDPRTWGGDYVETNAWGMSVSAVHDAAGLAELYGGPASLRAHLDALFAAPETADPTFQGWYGFVIHEQREARGVRAGMCALSNQPAHHIPMMYSATDAPWRAGAITHELANRLFSGAMLHQGFPGDEDNGEMSAWWLWAALGLYPLELASGELVIGDPLFDDISVARSNGATLRVLSTRESPNAHVLVAARLNGSPLSGGVLPVDALVADAVLELEFADAEPAPAAPETTVVPWAADVTASGTASGVADAAAVFNDTGADVVLVPGEAIEWHRDLSVTVTDASVTLVDAAAAGALSWQWLGADGEWHALPTTHTEPFVADRTTPFRFAKPERTSAVRVVANMPVRVRQLELFEL